MIDYERFDIGLEGNEVRVERTAGMGRVASHQLDLPTDDSEFAEALHLLRLEPEGDTERERLDHLRNMLAQVEALGGFSEVAQKVGEALFNAVFPEASEMRQHYSTALESATRISKGLRIELNITSAADSEEKSTLALPWEYLYDPDRGFFLACSGRTLLTRRIVLPHAVPRFTAKLPLRVLVVISEPHDQPLFGREEAWKHTEQGLQEAAAEGKIEYRLLAQPTFRAVTSELDTWKPHVLHFIGHGNFYEDKGGVLAFEDKYGAADVVLSHDLSQALCGRDLRLILLCSCRSAETDPADDFSGVTQALVKGGLPAVIAMQFSIPVVSANLFMKAFYSSLAQKKAIDEAVTSGRVALFSSDESATPRDWGIPVLYLQPDSHTLASGGKKPSVSEKAAEVEVPTNLQQFSGLRCANFVGRGEDMIRVAKALREPGVRRRFVTVTGLGGIGKSSLAIESAFWHLERRYFSGGVFWTSAKEVSLEILLNNMAAALGIQGFDTLDTESKMVALTKIHSDNEILFVIDNADSLRDDADFRRFLKKLSSTPRGRLILTARQPMNIDGEKCVELYVIGHDAAIDLFLYTWDIGKPTEGQKQQVAAICGRGMLEGHPLAIFTAASLARKEMNPDLTSLRERLRESIVKTLSDKSTSEEEVSVEASLRLSWDALQDKSKSLLSRVSVYRMPFREEAIAAVAGDLSDWNSAMVELLQHRLVLRYDSRYYLHPVVQSFAERELKSPEEVHLMAGEFLIDTEYLEEHLEAIDHFELAGARPRVVEAVSVIINQLHRRGFWGVAYTKLEQGLKAARELGDKQNEATMLGELGSNHLRRGVFRKAIEYHEQALAIAREIGDRQGEGTRLSNLGIAYAKLGDIGKAIEYHEQALAIAREIGDRQGEGNRLGNLGNAYHILGDVRKAIEYHEQALAIAREIGDRQGEGNALGSLGNAYRILGDVRKAIEYYEQALAIAREIGDRQGESNDLGNLGLAYRRLGDFRKAIEYHEQALDISREIGDRQGEGNDLGNLGLAYLSLGDVRKAIKYYEQALNIASEIDDKMMEGNSLGNLGLAYRRLGDFRKAIEYHEQALAISREIGDRRGEGNDLGNLGIVYIEMGDNEKGLMCLFKAQEIFENIESSYLKTVKYHIDTLQKKLGKSKYAKLEAQVRSRLARDT